MRNAALIVAVWLAGLGAAAQFGKISVSYQMLAALWPGHEGAGLGLMVSVVGLVGLVLGTSAGLLVARVGARRAMLAALLLGAAVSAVQAGLPGWTAMLATRVVEGLSHLAVVVVGPTVIAGAATLRWQSAAMTLWSSFFAVTYAVLALIAPPILSHGLSALFLAHAGWMAGCAVVLWALMPRDLPRVTAPGPRKGLPAEHLAIYASPFIAGPATGFVFYTLIYVAILTLLPPQFPPGLHGPVGAGMPLVSIAVSLTLGVWALRRVPAVRLVQAGFAAGVLAMAGLWATWGVPSVAAGFAFLMAAAMGIVQGASFASIPQLTHRPEDRARASGAVAQLGNLGTTTGTPLLAAITGAMGPAGFVAFALPLCAAGLAVVGWQARRRARASA
ncbi:MAG: MFS transporter [Paracoccaceae bacterium]